MTVIMEERELPLVSVSISNRFGAGHEESQVKGIAHFIEHLVFTGTATRTHEDISREIEKKGGVLNAFTSQEITSYWCKLPSEHLFSGLEILQDILENPVFDRLKFEREKKVILEEIKMYKDNPQHHVYDLIHRALYQKPFGASITGTESTIRGLSREFVTKYYRSHYSPANYIVVLVGKANFSRVCAYLEKAFPRRGAHISSLRPKIQWRKLRELREGIDQTHYVFGIHAPLSGTPEHYALEILDAHLANGMSSRLFLRIREELGLAYSVKSSLTTEKNFANYTISIGTTKEAIPQIQRIILDEFKKACSLDEADIVVARERAIGLHKIHQEESVHVMSELIFAELAGKAEDYYLREKHLRAVKNEQVRNVAHISRFGSAAIVPK